MASVLQREPYRYYQGRPWRRGYTTGACAAAAARAAVIFQQSGQVPTMVDIPLPGGERLEVPVDRVGRQEGKYWAAVTKDAGDDPDITHGLQVVACVEETPGTAVVIEGGPGVGRVTWPGLEVPVAAAAINPVPRRMIEEAVREIAAGRGWRVTVAVPGGEKIALRTLNPQLGIVGGISILGTTGIVEPMSQEAFKHSLVPQIDVALAAGYRTLVMVPGRQNQRQAWELFGFPQKMVVQSGNFIGFMLEEAGRRGVEQVLLLGGPGKLVKVAAGSFHTHNRVADGRQEVLAAEAAVAGAAPAVVRDILEAPTGNRGLLILQEAGLQEVVLEKIAARASRRAAAYGARFSGEAAAASSRPWRVGTVIVDRQGRVLAWDATGRELCRQWRQ